MRTFDYSKLSEMKWDSEILRYIAKINEFKGKQEIFLTQKPIELDRLMQIAKIQSTESSNKIEGIVTTSSRMKQLINDSTMPKTRDEKEIVGYRDVLNLIHENYDLIPLQPNYILQLHQMLLKHTGLSYGGSFKNVQNYINEMKSDGHVVTRFTPVAPFETPNAIESICDSYQRTNDLELIDPLILIPSFICDFLHIHPFNDGNGRISRLLTLLLLYQNGYFVGKYISIEKQIEKSKNVYYDALEQSDARWHEEKNDPTPFIKYFLQILLTCYVEFEERLGRVSNNGMKSSIYDVVKACVNKKIGKFTGADIIMECPSGSRASVLNAIKQLCEEGVITKCGSGRSTYYVKTDTIATSHHLSNKNL